MNKNSDDLSSKPCKCGDVMGEIIGFNDSLVDKNYQSFRVGWYCVKCRGFEKAILRERIIEWK